MKSALLNGHDLADGPWEVKPGEEVTGLIITFIARGEVGSKVTSGHGDKYVIDGTLTSTGGRIGLVRTVWIIDRGTTTPRFVTAYPRD